jgi:hypothetical protein
VRVSLKTAERLCEAGSDFDGFRGIPSRKEVLEELGARKGVPQSISRRLRAAPALSEPF